MKRSLLLSLAAAVALGLVASRTVLARPNCNEICNFTYCDPPCGGFYECYIAHKVCLESGSYCHFECYSGATWNEDCTCVTGGGNSSPVFVKPPPVLDPP